MASITVLGQRRALTDLDAVIAYTEKKLHEQLAMAARLEVAGEVAAQLRAVLRLTKDYLACLRESQAILRWTLPAKESPHPGARSGAEACFPPYGTVPAAARLRLVE